MDTFDKIGQVYIDALTGVIATCAGVTLEVSNRQPNNNFDEVTGVMYLNGKKVGMLFVTAQRPDVKLLCSRIIGVSIADVTEDEIDDTMCEIINMTAGSAKLRLSGSEYIFNLSSPFLLKGQNMHIIGKKKTRIISKVLGNEEISVKIKVVY